MGRYFVITLALIGALVGTLIGALTSSAAAADTAAVAPAACPPYARSIKLSSKTLDPDPSHNNALNITSIRNFLRARGHVFAGRHQKTLGVTSFQLAFTMSGKTYAVPTKGGYCIYLSEVVAEYGYRSHDVFVASEFVPGSCEYNAVMDHENQHVAINRNTIREGGPRLRQELERRLRTAPLKFIRDPQFGTDRALSEVYIAMKKFMDVIAAAQASRNSAIENAGNYDAIGNLCSNWDKGNV